MSLSPKHELFCQEYLIDLNAAAAARRAGYSLSNANDQGADLMAREDIQARVQELMIERAKRIGINQDYVLSGILDISRIGDNKEKLKAYELLGKHLQIFVDTSVTVNLDLAKKAEEYAKMTREQQIQLMREELDKLEGKK